MCCAYPIYIFEPGGPGPGVYSITWLWVFAFPPMAAGSAGMTSLAGVLLVANPHIYGLIWTLAWEMYRLSRQSQAEG